MLPDASADSLETSAPTCRMDLQEKLRQYANVVARSSQTPSCAQAVHRPAPSQPDKAPCSAGRGQCSGAHLVGGVALVAQAAVLLSGGGQAAQLAVLVHRVHDPVDARVLHNGDITPQTEIVLEVHPPHTACAAACRCP